MLNRNENLTIRSRNYTFASEVNWESVSVGFPGLSFFIFLFLFSKKNKQITPSNKVIDKKERQWFSFSLFFSLFPFSFIFFHFLFLSCWADFRWVVNSSFCFLFVSFFVRSKATWLLSFLLFFLSSFLLGRKQLDLS